MELPGIIQRYMRKKDFAALFTDADHLDYCQLHLHEDGLKEERRVRVDWTSPNEDAGLDAWIAAIDPPLQQLTAQLAEDEHRFAVCMTSERFLFKVLSLPSVQRDEIAQMVELQLEKISPFAPDNTLWGFEVLRGTESESTVLVCVGALDQVEPLLSHLNHHKIWVERLDLDVCAVWRQIHRGHVVPAEGVTAVVWYNGPQSFLMICEGDPILIRALSLRISIPVDASILLPGAGSTLGHGAIPSGLLPSEPAEQGAGTEADEEDPFLKLHEESAAKEAEEEAPIEMYFTDPVEVIAAEIEFSGASLEAERGIPMAERILLLDPGDRVSKEEIKRLTERTGLPVDQIGAARFTIDVARSSADATCHQTETALDLLPSDWHARYRKHVSKNLAWRSLLYFLAFYLAGTLVFAGILKLRTNQLAKLNSQYGELRPQVEQLRATQQQVEGFERYADLSQSPIEILLSLVREMPPLMSLERTTFSKRSNEVTLKGIAAERNAITEYMERLRQTTDPLGRPLFSDVKQESTIREEARGGRSRQQVNVFELKCQINDPSKPTHEASPAKNTAQ